MKRNLIFIVILATIVIFTQGTVYSNEGEDVFEDPILITSIGQSPDSQMARAIVAKIKLDYNYDELMRAEDLGDDYKTVIAVVGGSSKGLGAAGLDEDEEMERAKKLLNAIEEKEMKLLAMHIGGSARRGAVSDPFIETVFSKADHLIVYEDGDEDEFMKKIAEENEIEISYVDKVVNAEKPLRKVFDKEE